MCILPDRQADALRALVPLQVIRTLGMVLVFIAKSDPIRLDAAVWGQNHGAEAGRAVRYSDALCEVCFAVCHRGDRLESSIRQSITLMQVTVV